MSTPAVSPKCRSARSFSVSDGMLTCTPGRLMPLWSLMGPPLTTRVRTLVPSLSSATSSMVPSASRMRSPGCTSRAKREYPVEARSAVPTRVSVVMVKVAPVSSVA